MQIGKFHVLYLTPNDLLCAWTTFLRNEMKGSSKLACSFTIPLTVDPTKLWILGDVIRNIATGIVFHKILLTKNFFLLENKWISSSCLGSYDEWSSNGIGIKDGFLLSICQLGTLMYANLYKYVPLLMCLFQIAKILSLTISKCFDPAGQWHSPIYHLMDLTSSKDLDGAKTRKMTSLLFLPVLLLVFYMLFPIVFVSSFGVPHRLCREPSATNLY